jgi:hypothetical protein
MTTKETTRTLEPLPPAIEALVAPARVVLEKPEIVRARILARGATAKPAGYLPSVFRRGCRGRARGLGCGSVSDAEEAHPADRCRAARAVSIDGAGIAQAHDGASLRTFLAGDARQSQTGSARATNVCGSTPSESVPQGSQRHRGASVPRTGSPVRGPGRLRVRPCHRSRARA